MSDEVKYETVAWNDNEGGDDIDPHPGPGVTDDPRASVVGERRGAQECEYELARLRKLYEPSAADQR